MSSVCNLDVRSLVSNSKIRYQDIADEMGVSRVWVSTLMRSELSQKNRDRILLAVKNLRKKQGMDDCVCPYCGHGIEKAHWIETHDFDDIPSAMQPLGRVVVCSSCGYPENRVASRYCPNCGAKMKNWYKAEGED